MKCHSQEKKLKDIPWGEVIFSVDELKRDPKILVLARLILRRRGVDVDSINGEMFQKLTKGLLIKIWLNHGGKIV